MTKPCGVCKKLESKYKCPSCYVPYCSVNCCEKHKRKKCEPPSIPNGENKEEYKFVTLDTVSQEKLKSLEHSKELKISLDNPHVRKIIESIDSSSNPQTVLEKAMLEPIFVEFVEQCLKVVEPHVDD